MNPEETAKLSEEFLKFVEKWKGLSAEEKARQRDDFSRELKIYAERFDPNPGAKRPLGARKE